jgi:diguanylate cyclase (GGDEF)-like protein
MRFTLVAAVFTLLFAPYFAWIVRLPNIGLMNALYGMSLVATPVILHRTRSIRIATNWTLSCSFAVLLVQSWTLGGVSSLSYPWLSCIPMSAMLLRGVRGGAIWTLVSVAGVVVVGVADAMGLVPGAVTPGVTARSASMVTVASLTLALGGLAWMAESRSEQLLQDLQQQTLIFQERSVRDWLTGLANRSLLTACLIQSWERALRHGPRGALFFIDLNDFKLINDEHGHAAGDRVLREVALRLQDTVRSSDLVGRIGGDEFALIVEGVESHADVAALGEKIAQAIEKPIEIGEPTAHISASVGIAFFPDRECHFGDRITLPSIPVGGGAVRGEVDHESVRRLLEKADAAMYTAKRKALRYWIHEHVADETLRGTVSRVSEPPPAA